MAMQRGPQMPIGKLKSPGVFGQQEKPAEPSWRAAAPGGTKFNVNKPATGPTVAATSPAAPSTASSVSSPTSQAPPAETASPPPTATSPAPSATNKLNLSKFQQAPKASPLAAPTTVAAAAAVTSSGSLPSNNKSPATSTSSNAPATSPVSSVSSPTTQAPPAETASPPPTATSPAPSAANKLNLSKFQQAPKVAPKPNVPSPSPVATPSTAASSAGTPTAATATAAAVAAVPAPKKEVPSPTAPVAVTNRVIPTKPSATVNGGKSSGTPSPAINTPTPVPSPSLPAASTVKPPETVLRAPVAVASDTIVRASAQAAHSAPTSISATPSPAAATTQPASPAAHQPTSPLLDADKPKCPPDVVLDPPSELRFRGSYSDGITTRLRLTNKSTESRICFKVKTNVPLYYSVQPSIDLIEPLHHVDVAVHLQATSGGRPDADGQHKFMVQSIYAPDGEIASLDRLWQQARPQEITSSKLVCCFEQVVESRPVKRASGVFNGIETSQVTQPKKRDSKQTTKSSSGILWVFVLAVVVAVIAVAVYQSSLK